MGLVNAEQIIEYYEYYGFLWTPQFVQMSSLLQLRNAPYITFVCQLQAVCGKPEAFLIYKLLANS